MEWLIWFDVMMIVGIVAFLGFVHAMGPTSHRSAREEPRPQRRSAKGAELRGGTKATRASAGIEA